MRIPCPVYKRPHWQFQRCYPSCSGRINLWKALTNQRGSCWGNGNGGQPAKPQRLWIGEYGHSHLYNLPPGKDPFIPENWGKHFIDTESIYDMCWHPQSNMPYFASENEDKVGRVYRMNNWNLEAVCEKGENFYCHQVFTHGTELRAVFNYHNGNRETYTYLWGSPNGNPETWQEVATSSQQPNYRFKAFCSWKGSIYGAGYLRDDPSGREAGILVKQNGSAFDTILTLESYPFDGVGVGKNCLLLGNYLGATIWLWRGSGAPSCVFTKKAQWGEGSSIIRFAKVGNYYYAGGRGASCAVVLRSPDCEHWAQYKDLHGNDEVRGMCEWIAPDGKPKLVVVCGRSGSDNAWIHDPALDTWQAVGFSGETSGSYFSCGTSPV